MEVYLAAGLQDLLAHTFYHARQLVRPNVRVSVHQDISGRAVLAEYAQHFVHGASLLAAGEKLAVAIGSCTAFAEAVVALGVNALLTGDSCHVALALPDVLSTLQHYRAQTELNKMERRKETARACSDYDNLWAPCHVGVADGGDVGRRCWLVHISLYGEVDDDVALSSINGAMANAEIHQPADIYGKLVRHVFTQYGSLKGYVGRYAELKLLQGLGS